MKPMLTAPGTKHLKLYYDEPPSNFAFKFSMRCYTRVRDFAVDVSGDFEPLLAAVRGASVVFHLASYGMSGGAVGQKCSSACPPCQQSPCA